MGPIRDGSYSTSACSWVRLTATLSTPGLRLSAFSMVLVQSEQWSPPMRARMRARSGRFAGSSVQSRWPVDVVAIEMPMVASKRSLPEGKPCGLPCSQMKPAPRINIRSQVGSSGGQPWPGAETGAAALSPLVHNRISGLTDRCHETILAHGL